ncbi:uncharacterized protein LOC144442794 [Glandiceps talaboti]
MSLIKFRVGYLAAVNLKSLSRHQRCLGLINTSTRRLSVNCSSCSQRLKTTEDFNSVHREVLKFDPTLAVESAVTPPSSWFTNPDILQLEYQTVFNNHWLFVGRRDVVQKPRQFLSGIVGHNPYVVLRDENNELRSFFNVCRHHAMTIINDDDGSVDSLQCPYHGWTYALDGKLTKATRLRGIQNFSARNFGLKSMEVTTWGPLVFIRPDRTSDGNDLFQEMAPLKEELDDLGFSSGLRFLERKSYILNCNWKVFVDNYLDGGYHVEIAHKDLGGALNLKSYQTEVHRNHSIQSVSSLDSEERVSGKAIYAYIFPNFMVNRYGPWMDLNTVLPLATNKCEVVFHYFLDEEFIQKIGEQRIGQYLKESFEASDKVQQEDIFLCEGVQRGLTSSAYDVGRYAPRVEHADHSFHVRLAEIYRNHLNLQ